MSAATAPINTFTITAPDDWHIHLRDGQALATTVPHAAANFRRAICMPNLVPPVKTAADAIAYRERILARVPNDSISQQFEPLMTLYLTESLTAEDIEAAVDSGVVKAVKLYPCRCDHQFCGWGEPYQSLHRCICQDGSVGFAAVGSW